MKGWPRARLNAVRVATPYVMPQAFAERSGTPLRWIILETMLPRQKESVPATPRRDRRAVRIEAGAGDLRPVEQADADGAEDAAHRDAALDRLAEEERAEEEVHDRGERDTTARSPDGRYCPP